MPRWILIASLLTLTVSGCATRRAEFVPPGTDRDELAAAIAWHGQDTSAEGRAPTPESSRVATAADVTAKVVTGTAYVAGALLYAVAKAGGPR